MNITERRLHEMLERVNAFGYAHEKDFPAGTIGHQMFATVGVCLRDVLRQASGLASARRHGAAASKARARTVLWALLAAIRRTARAIALDTPGFDRPFRLPRGNGAPRLLAASRALKTAASTSKAEFVAHGLAPTFIDDLARRIDAFERAMRESRENRFARRSAVTELRASLEAGLRAVQRLDAVVPNLFSEDVEVMARWRAARRVVRAARRPDAATAAQQPIRLSVA
jgi:hypothetical protein